MPSASKTDKDLNRLIDLRREAAERGDTPCFCGKTIHLIYCGTCGIPLYTSNHALPVGCDKHQPH